MTAALEEDVRGIVVRAPAKINLYLDVGAVGTDGFHPVTTIYQAISLYDDVEVAPSAHLTLEIEATAEHVKPELLPRDMADNIVLRAANLLGEFHGIEPYADIKVRKNIPIGGGMAGGSADAAAALVALDRLWECQTSDDDLLALAAQLGSDVPFALLGGLALGTGRGETLQPLEPHPSMWWVILPRGGQPTGQVYQRFDELGVPDDAKPCEVSEVVAALDGAETMDPALAFNALHWAAVDLDPLIEDALSVGEASGAMLAMVSGSGSTTLFGARDSDDARRVAAYFESVGESPLVATGPVAGAHLVEYA